MLFRVQADLRFSTAAARTAARATIASAISGDNSVVVADVDHARKGGFNLYWEIEEQDTGDAGATYAIIQAMATPLAGSRVNHHTCFHGDNTNRCIPTAERVW